jgi:transcriptional regulator with XRE-family HTH domain
MPRTLRSPRHERLRLLLIEARKAAGLTQAEVARRLSRYQSFVATLESGQRRVDVVEFLELAEVIEYDPVRMLKKIQRVGREGRPSTRRRRT